MDCQNDCCHAYCRATPADADPTGQPVVYWAWKSASRCTNAVEPGATRLTAPPSASNAIPPDPPGAPFTRCRFSTLDSRVPIAWLLNGLVTKSDLAYSEARDSWPPAVWGGRGHSSTVRPAQPASTNIACSQEVLSRKCEDGPEPTAAYSFSS